MEREYAKGIQLLTVAPRLERKLQRMQETEMAVTISQEQNEVQTDQKWGLDIQSHRAKMESESWIESSRILPIHA